MNILAAFIVFDILIIVYEVMVEFFSALYELSGLTKEQARFQVTSLLTGTGFTTAESEKMLETKKRKRVTRDIMIMSYIFNISIISTLVTLFTSTNNANIIQLLIGLLISMFIILLLFFSKKVTKMRNFIDKTVLNFVGKIFYKKNNSIIIYDYFDKSVLAEIKLSKMPECIKEKSIQEIEQKYDINILAIKRKNKVTCAVKDNMKLYRRDVVILVGERRKINKIFA